ncbi:hypothetical protein [Planctomicrobium sp. SH527]|uniref:hypothetical protein n=1 Tax=Planctomicrobium sp. SH527 TaxID=3448123 RepID=UPI003F5B86D8
MVTSIRKWSLQCLLTGMMLPVFPALADDAEAVVRLGQKRDTGIVRISDTQRTVIRAQSPDAAGNQHPIEALPQVELTNCQQEVGAVQGDVGANAGAAACPEGTVVYESHRSHRGSNRKSAYYSNGQHDDVPLFLKLASCFRNDLAYKGAWVRGKTGIHDGYNANGEYCPPGSHCRHGNGGYGRTRLGENPIAGHYSMVYPVDPNYFDKRDGQVYAAQGYGGPVAVPLAPVVNHSYNYGWGIPSSRLTPVLHPVTQAPISQVPSPIPTAPISY